MDYGSVANLTIPEIHTMVSMKISMHSWATYPAEASHFPKYHLRWDLE